VDTKELQDKYPVEPPYEWHTSSAFFTGIVNPHTVKHWYGWYRNGSVGWHNEDGGFSGLSNVDVPSEEEGLALIYARFLLGMN
jgi:hypothetical protein